MKSELAPRRLGPASAALARVAVLFGVLFAVDSAAACPVCFTSANDENRTAFMLMTGFLTVLPLGLIGFAIRWYIRRVKDFEKQNQRERRAARRRAPPDPNRVRVRARLSTQRS